MPVGLANLVSSRLGRGCLLSACGDRGALSCRFCREGSQISFVILSSFPPMPVIPADISPIMLGAASWQQSNTVLHGVQRRYLRVPHGQQPRTQRVSAQCKDKSRRGAKRRDEGWEEGSRCLSSCLETGGQMWSELD